MSSDELLQCLQEDMNMLLDDEWVPDYDSAEAHMDVAEELHERVGVALVDIDKMEEEYEELLRDASRDAAVQDAQIEQLRRELQTLRAQALR
jgi:hypothetical protein